MDRQKNHVLSLLALMTVLFHGASAAAISLPSGFTAETAASGFSVPVLARFSDDGLLFVVEKAGRVWAHNGSTKSPTPVVDFVSEVNNDHDRGMLGFTLHPEWVPDGGPNSWIYLLYTVSPIFGQDLSYNQNNRYSFSRLKRCRTQKVGGWPVAILTDEDGDGDSCQTLLGKQAANGHVNDGIASLHNSHSTCDLHFGADGTLLVINGDGAHYNFADYGGQNAPAYQNYSLTPPPGKSAPWFGPMPLYEDSGSFRSQDLRSLAGKVLRIDPNTGLGLPSNPFYTGNPGDHQSKVWAGGLRNPFRSAMMPGTGSADPEDAEPGVIMLGEVGWGVWEEVNVVLGGENFGWPRFEGAALMTSYSGYTRNPNPLGLPDGQTLGGKNDPATFKTHRLPVVAWHHSDPAKLWPTGIHPTGFKGNSATGGDFYVGAAYPQQYQGGYFFADYAQQWIRVLKFNSSYQAVSVLDFALQAGGPVDLVRHPILNDLYYVNIWSGSIVRIRYGANAVPQASVFASPQTGPAPLLVSFDATGSTDAEQFSSTLRYDWSFGDGVVLPDAGPEVEHTYLAGGTYTATVTVTDFEGATDTAQVVVAANNSPPQALLLTPEDGSLYDAELMLPILAQGTAFDAEDPTSALQLTWDVTQHHLDPDDPSQNHAHFFGTGSGTSFGFTPEPHGGTDDIIAFSVRLTATDSGGLSDTAEAYLFPSNAGVYPWIASDVGAHLDGSDVRTHYAGFDISGAGLGMAGTEDGLRFIHRLVTGNFLISLRLDALSGAGSEAGVALRSDTSPDAAVAAVVVGSDGVLQVLHRATDNSPLLVLATENVALNEVWLRLEREGSTFRAYRSSEGGDWVLTHMWASPLAAQGRAGFFVASGAPTTLSTASFREVELTYGSACGDGIVDAEEECDDGNSASGDCCSAQCLAEALGAACGVTACTSGTCSGTGICQLTYLSGPCSDGNACTAGETCQAGACAGATPLSCNDGNPCTVDSCSTLTGCVYTPAPGGCSDGNVCTTGDTCVGGACVAGTAVVCNDGKFCTTDICDPVAGCTFVPNSLPCTDGNPCTLNDTCSGGVCTSSTAAVCNDGNPCTSDSCYSDVGCLYLPVALPCNDGNPCTLVDTCVAGVCAGQGTPSCDDGNPCTDDTCVSGAGCSSTPNAAPCSDGNVCTVADACTNGACVGGVGATCNDSNSCTLDSCDPVSGCVFALNPLGCATDLSGWSKGSIGSAPVGTTNVFTLGGVRLGGAGAGLAVAGDAGWSTFTYTNGNFELRARVDGISGNGTRRVAGLGARYSLASLSPHVSVQVDSAGATEVVWRQGWGGAVQKVTGPTLALGAAWLRIVRSDAGVAGFVSSDGATWTLVGQAPLQLPCAAHVGIFSASGSSTAVSTSVLSSVQLTTQGAEASALSCSQPLSPWSATDIGGALPGKAVLLSPSALDVEAEGSVIWGKSDQFRFVHRTVTGDFAIQLRVQALGNTNNWAKTGLMIRGGMQANERNLLLYVAPTAGAWLQFRSSVDGWTAGSKVANLLPPNAWLRLVRQGNTITSFVSVDGVSWIQSATTPMNLPASVQVGVATTSGRLQFFTLAQLRSLELSTDQGPSAVCGNGTVEVGEQCDDGNLVNGDCCASTCTLEPDATVCAAGNFCTGPSTCAAGTCVQGSAVVCNDNNSCTIDACNPASGCTFTLSSGLCAYTQGPWTGTNVGGALPAGTLSGDPSSSFSLTGGGADIWGQSDAFHYLYQQREGDFDARVRVSSLAFTHYWAKAGLMVRSSLAAGSANTFVLVPANGLHTYHQRRLTDGALTQAITGPAAAFPNVWLRLVRQGNTVRSFSSNDGANWTLISENTLPLGPSAYIGLAVTSHNQGNATTAALSALTIL
jgi:cysteine-rich repeat protein